MPAERLSMRKVREVLRLKYACGASARVIAQSLGIGRTVIGEYIRRAAVIGITWPIPAAETHIVRDNALQRANFSLEFRIGKHHLRKCDGMRPDVLCLGKIYIVRVHERLLPPPSFAGSGR